MLWTDFPEHSGCGHEGHGKRKIWIKRPLWEINTVWFLQCLLFCYYDSDIMAMALINHVSASRLCSLLNQQHELKCLKPLIQATHCAPQCGKAPPPPPSLCCHLLLWSYEWIYRGWCRGQMVHSGGMLPPHDTFTYGKIQFSSAFRRWKHKGQLLR